MCPPAAGGPRRSTVAVGRSTVAGERSTVAGGRSVVAVGMRKNLYMDFILSEI